MDNAGHAEKMDEFKNRLPSVYEEDVYVDDVYVEPDEYVDDGKRLEDDEEGDILTQKGRENLRAIELEDKGFGEGHIEKGEAVERDSDFTPGALYSQNPKTYRGQALDFVVRSGIEYVGTASLLGAADVVATWLAGQDRPLPAPAPGSWDAEPYQGG